jgi:alcohol dehydrogenase class IV
MEGTNTVFQVAGVGGVVGVGGGSSMDAAKMAAFLCGDTRSNI